MFVYSKHKENVLLVFTFMFRHFGANKSTLFVENAKKKILFKNV